MSKITKRGHCPTDEQEFGKNSQERLHKASEDIYYLLNHGYNIKGASTFVGNHYLLSERQRLALSRAVSASEDIKARALKENSSNIAGSTVNIDGFNTIITLEVALSGSLLLKCMDGTVRDLAGLRGTYNIIDKTQTAIMLIGQFLQENKAQKAVFYLDAPVSNSGRLKIQIFETLSRFDFQVKAEVINGVDSTLEKLSNVITSDAIILDKCQSWINLNSKIIEKEIPNYWHVDFGLQSW